MTKPFTLHDLERAARRRLPRMVADFIDGGAEDERTLRQNRTAFSRYTLRPHLLGGSAIREQRVTVLGQDLATPVILAPTGLSRLAGPGGERAAALAAHSRGTVSVVSSASSQSVEEVAEGLTPPPWFQLYPWGDWDLTSRLMARARNAGCSTLVVTLDVPVTGARERDYRNGMTVPVRLTPSSAFDILRHPRWVAGLLRTPRLTMANLVGLKEGRSTSAASLAQLNMDLLNPSYSWDDLARVRDAWQGKLLVKGILSARDARAAVEHGVDGVVVSNHGGRQADAVPAALDVLPEVLAEVGAEAEVILDGGVRRGSDVIMALALGARAVMVGRPWMHGLAVGGQSGVELMLDILRQEVDRTLALIGCRAVAELDSSFLGTAPGSGEVQ